MPMTLEELEMKSDARHTVTTIYVAILGLTLPAKVNALVVIEQLFVGWLGDKLGRKEGRKKIQRNTGS